MIPFLNPWDHGSAQEVFPGFLVIIRMIRKVQNVQKTGDLEDLGHFDGDFVIVTPHMIPFWNPWNHGSYQLVFQGFLVIIRMIRKVQNFQILGIWRIWGHLDKDFVIVNPHMIPFLNPWDHRSAQDRVQTGILPFLKGFYFFKNIKKKL